ncbi:accessory Sec-dependent serine-rich glycoprotein adhesin, partial [Streptococcus sp. 27098_8_186]
MFFKRSNGSFRETDRVTRFKLIKSGKNWLRAATSNLGLFKVVRGQVEELVVAEVSEETTATPSRTLLKGILATGAILGGAVVTTAAQADEADAKTATTSELGKDALAEADSVVLGTISVSDSQSMSASESEEASISLSESASESVSETQSVSTSESEEASTSLSESVSVSDSQSMSASESEEASTSLSESASESVSESQSVSTSESEEASTSLSESVSESQSVSTSESEEASISL